MLISSKKIQSLDFQILSWGEDYFGVNEKGNLSVRQEKNGPDCDLYELTQSLVNRGITPPFLVRFEGILKNRQEEIAKAFDKAILESNYDGSFQLAYPVKVNQKKHLVETISQKLKLSLEVGNKTELLLSLTFPSTLILCNGYKDKSYIELALLSTKLGKRPILILERKEELEIVLNVAEKFGIDPEIGLRMKPFMVKCEKFGLNSCEILSILDILQEKKRTHWVKLLHFHINSQLNDLTLLKKILNEAGHLYAELAKRCQSLTFFDAGGGLGINYLSSKKVDKFSVNYSIEEYAKSIIETICEICKKKGVATPNIITESGRALTAHHTVLITEVISSTKHSYFPQKLPKITSSHPLICRLKTLYLECESIPLLKHFEQAKKWMIEIEEALSCGEVSLEEKAYAEKVFRFLCAKLHRLNPCHKIEELYEMVKELYLCNFSIFQSLPDAWGIDQIFPVLPIHRLNEKRDVCCYLKDLTCDSDGQIFEFFDDPVLKLHKLDERPYYLGIFLVGAYQESLASAHNLFGNTHVVHIDADGENLLKIVRLIQGETSQNILEHKNYKDMLCNLKEIIKQLKVSDKDIFEEKILKALSSYSYPDFRD